MRSTGRAIPGYRAASSHTGGTSCAWARRWPSTRSWISCGDDRACARSPELFGTSPGAFLRPWRRHLQARVLSDARAGTSRSAGERAEGYPARGSEANAHATTIRRSLDPLDPARTKCHPGLERETCPSSRARMREATRRHRAGDRDGSGPSLAREGGKRPHGPGSRSFSVRVHRHSNDRTEPKPAGQCTSCPDTKRGTWHQSIAPRDIPRAIRKTEYAPTPLERSRSVQSARSVPNSFHSSPSTERRRG